MFLKLFDRIQTASIMRMPAYGSYMTESKLREEKNRAAGNTSEGKDSKKSSNDINAANSNNASKANPVGEASMPAGAHIKDDQNPGVINLGFGVQIDTKKGSSASVTPEMFQAAAQNPNPAIPVQNSYLDFLNSVANVTNAPAGLGNHAVDMPKKEKPKTVKAEEDNVNVDLGNINIETNPKAPPKQWPDAVSNPLPQAGPIQEVANIPVFDNSAVTSRANCRYLKDIEKLAIECGVQIQMLARAGINGEDSGLISCIVYTPESDKPNPYKGFTIDTGMIIDKRAKVFPAIINTGFEDIPAYPVLIPKSSDNETGKSKNILNENLFRKIFTGGVQMLSDERAMYTTDYAELNKNVAIITMPTNNMNKDIRTAVRDRLMAAMKAGVFDAVHQNDPYARFRFKSGGYDKKTQHFVLTNVGVPYRFGGTCQSTKEIEIEFTFDEEGKPKTKINYIS